ncbi:nucleotidyl transferase AbiEii/AbiGii toxin family protein [Candidatus Kaiserbacteria bacterium]|nr:nucleotidyl transferase AbiEii/AbiGii toxin family protein [Candidatus Kaiserbacteria bacterium]
MHSEILTEKQRNLLPLVAHFRKDFGLVGGTAVALHIGHRESIDFDMFSKERFSNIALRRKIERMRRIDTELVNKETEFTFLIDSVKFTFFQYPFDIDFSMRFETIARIPTLLTLAAMKIYALAHRAKWKDYVDLYFILRDYHQLPEIVREAENIFGDSFNPKLIRQQLSYFKDINYDEPVTFMPGFEVSEKEIKNKLTEFSLS